MSHCLFAKQDKHVYVYRARAKILLLECCYEHVLHAAFDPHGVRYGAATNESLNTQLMRTGEQVYQVSSAIITA